MKKKIFILAGLLLAAPLLAGPAQDHHPARPEAVESPYPPVYLPNFEETLAKTLSQLSETPPKSPQAATLLNDLGTINHEMGRYQEAERNYTLAIQTWKAISDDDPLHIGRPIFNLSTLYLENYMFAKAERLDLRRLAGRLTEQHPHKDLTARILNNIAFLELRKNRAGQAERAWLKALSIWKDFSPDSFLVVQTLNNLTYLYGLQGRKTEVEASARRGLDLAGPLIAAGGRNRLWLLAMSATLRLGIRDLSGAKVSSQRALLIAEETLGPDHPDTARFLLLHADVLTKMHDGAAKRYRTRGIAILDRSYFGEIKRHTVDFTELGDSFR